MKNLFKREKVYVSHQYARMLQQLDDEKQVAELTKFATNRAAQKRANRQGKAVVIRYS